MSPSLKHSFKRALSLPPHIVLKKLLIMGKNRWQLYRKDCADHKKSTYSHFEATLSSFVTLPKNPPFVQKHLLDHHFNLLGSGLVEVKYGMQAKGLEGHVYPCQAALPLKERINAANLEHAEKVWALLDHDYKPIDWQIDFKSGYRWSEKTRSHRIQYGHLPGVDVKVPWELARMQHLPQLAWAYAREKKDIYVREFRNQILDFIANNPPRFGVNWSCTMDVGIRVVNWLITYDLLTKYGFLFDSEFENVFISSIYDHGKHIIEHLEWMPTFRSNHYLANITGLLFVSAYLPQANEWLNFSIDELIKEVPLQFHEDGSSFEGSTSYHCLSAQMIAYASALAICRKGQECFPPWYYARLEKMADFVLDITKPNAEIVQVGDHDSGYLLRLFPPYDNHLNRQVLIEELSFNSIYPHTLPSHKQRQQKALFGDLATCKEKLKDLKQTQISFPCMTDNIKWCAYPDFGLYIYRNTHFFLSVRVGSIGHLGRGGHAHNDQLCVELVIDGKEIAVDPGTYLYTPLPKRRNDYRSVKAHFAPQISGKEPSGIETGVFIMDKDPLGKCLHCDKQSFLGMHTGYGFPVYRLIEFGAEIVITDFSAGDTLVPIEKVLQQVQLVPFSPGYGLTQT
jgi:hypothetical protein